MSQKSMTSRIAILGSGEVGSTIAYSLILNPVAGEILLVDPKEEVRDAQVQDLSDATFHGDTSTMVRAGTHKEAGQCDIVIITAGAAQKKGKLIAPTLPHIEPCTDYFLGESRTDLVGRNLKILGSAIEDIKPFREDTIILLVTNPVDILTYFAQKFSGLPKEQVIGSGTFLDSARLRGILSKKCGVAASSIDAYVLGEHGDSQMVSFLWANEPMELFTNRNNRSHGQTQQSAASPSNPLSQTPPSTNPPSQKIPKTKPPPSQKPKVLPPTVSAVYLLPSADLFCLMSVSSDPSVTTKRIWMCVFPCLLLLVERVL
jgi:hypothetical protein